MPNDPIPLIDHPAYNAGSGTEMSLGDTFLKVLKDAIAESDEAKEKAGSEELKGMISLVIVARRMNVTLAEAKLLAEQLSSLGYLRIEPHCMKFMEGQKLENILFVAPVA